MEIKETDNMIDEEFSEYDEELDRMYEESIVEIKEGQILKGKIVQVSEKEVLVDIGYKSEGTVYKSEISDPEELKIGSEIDVMLEAKENDYGMVVLSHEKAKKLRSWQDIIDNQQEGNIIEGKVSRKVRGGFMVDVGMQAFLPASLSMMQEFGGPDSLVGKKLNFTIVKINAQRKNIVLSRKEIVDEKRRGEKQIILEGLNKGDLVKGVVRNITDFGAFVDIGGGITGLLHITDMSWGRISHPSDVVKVGDDLEVKVLDFDKEAVKVSLGLKQKDSNPWENIEDKYPEGGTVSGKVVNIMPYGIFVELERGIEGLIHISEFSWSKKFNHPNEKFKVGDSVEAMVLRSDKGSQKLSLGIKQLDKDPWEGVGANYTAGDRIKGMISAVTEYGAFIELEKGIEGLIHVSDLSWTKRVANPKDRLKKGEEIEAIILNVDEQNRRIALGVKQLTPDPWDEIIIKYKPGTVSDGVITNITNFGIFVELEKDLEGLLHVSEVELAPGQRMEDLCKVGDTIKVKVIHIDGVQKKIALSNKAIDGEAPKAEEGKTEEKAEETKSEEKTEEAKPEGQPAETKSEETADEVKPEETKEAPAETETPVESETPTEDAVSTENETPAEDSTPTENETPAESEAPTEGDAPTEEENKE